VVALSTSGALAHDLVNISVEMDGWTMLPFADAGATTHIIATRNDNEALATDIDVVLYEKTINGWDGSAYDPSVTKEDALIDIANEFGLADPLGGSWQVDIDQANVLEFVLPRVGFGKGFFVTDPLFDIAIHIDDPEPLAQGAEDAGLPSGSGAINTGGISGGGLGGSDAGGGQTVGGCGCDQACIQYMIAAGSDVYALSNPTTQEEADQALDDADLAMADYVIAFFPCCRKRTVTNSFNDGNWACGAWTLTNGPTPAGGQANYMFNCSYSRTATKTQTRTRIRTCRNCVRCTWRQTRTLTSVEQTTRSTVTAFPPTLPVCPPAPISGPGCSGFEVDDDLTTAWTPASPCCP